ncbi:MAG: dUTP diphosphatase [Anderseniella sp.]|nr:dUTP diphosphatase [Anderseniella sp.]
MKIEIKQLSPSAVVPESMTDGSAGFDLCVLKDVKLFHGQQMTVGTGIAVHIADPGVVGQVHIRSSLGQLGLVLGNGTGIIDSDYQGEIKLILRNSNQQGQPRGIIEMKAGERVAQMLLMPVVSPELVTVDEFGTTTKRGTGGVGSTGKRGPGRPKKEPAE